MLLRVSSKKWTRPRFSNKCSILKFFACKLKYSIQKCFTLEQNYPILKFVFLELRCVSSRFFLLIKLKCFPSSNCLILQWNISTSIDNSVTECLFVMKISYPIPEVKVWFSWTKTLHNWVGFLLINITASMAAQSRLFIMRAYSIHNSTEGHTAPCYTLWIHSFICVPVAKFNCFFVINVNYSSSF